MPRHVTSGDQSERLPDDATRPRRITVINDNPEFLEMMEELLESDGYDVSVIDGDNIASIEPIREKHPELVIVDLRLRGADLSGWDIALAVRADREMCALPMIVCTADVWQTRERAEELAALPAVEILLKPFTLDEVDALLQRMFAAPAAD